MTRDKRLSINSRLMKAFSALDKAGLNVVTSTTEYGTWSDFTVFEIGNTERALHVEMSDKSEFVKFRLAGIEKEYSDVTRNTIETYIAVFTAIVTFDNVE